METSPVRDPRQPPRQAVVLIHGIGEQRPMETLRGFVASLLAKGSFHSKPDLISGSYELRRLKLRRVAPDGKGHPGLNGAWPETDFFEYYWAHQMHGTTVSHVLNWWLRTMWRGWRILLRPKGHARLRTIAASMFALQAACLALLVLGVVAYPALQPALQNLTTLGWMSVLLLAAGGLAVKLLRCRLLGGLTDVVGDAARYFDVSPRNVARRYDILRGGTEALRKLHESCDERNGEVVFRYGRIVLIGHSLGSVIAYDILRHYWAEVNGRIAVAPDELATVENFDAPISRARFDGARPYADVRHYWKAQARLWLAVAGRVPAGRVLSLDRLWQADVQRRHAAACAAGSSGLPGVDPSPARPAAWRPARWLVSDLITLGSPLAYAPVLLANGTLDMRRKLRLRELSTCPPNRSRHLRPGRFVVDLSAELEQFDSHPIIHHGAPFALTRWTNLWYPNDPIGGPLHPSFGQGIRDVRLDKTSSLLRSHVQYWAADRPSGLVYVKKILLLRRWPSALGASTNAPAAAPRPT